MIGAKVDGRIVPIDSIVKTGQIIEIMTSSQQGKGPSRDWLKIVKTSSARTKIRGWFKKEKRKENIEEGRAEVEREFRRNKIILDNASYEEFVRMLAERQHMPNVDDFYAAIGYGGISLMKMMPQIKENYTKLVKASEPVADEIAVTAPKKRAKSSEGVIVENIDNCLVKFAHCCNPLPGDEIIGFITRGHGVSIHNRHCPNVPQNIETCAEPERWLKAYWDSNLKEDYNATLSIICIDKVGLLAEISGKFAEMRVMIHSVNMRSVKDGRAIMNVTITVEGAEHLRNVMAKIQKIDGVLLVERAGI